MAHHLNNLFAYPGGRAHDGKVQEAGVRRSLDIISAPPRTRGGGARVHGSVRVQPVSDVAVDLNQLMQSGRAHPTALAHEAQLRAAASNEVERGHRGGGGDRRPFEKS